MSDNTKDTSKKKGCLIASLVLVALIIGGIVVTIGGCGLLVHSVNSSIEVEKEAKIQQAQSLQNATPSDLKPYGKLSELFGVMSQYTDIQRENAESDIVGKVVEWQLQVYEVSTHEDYYKIQTQSNQNVGTFVHLYPQSDREREFIENLMTGNVIRVRGSISGVFMRNVEIDPAILISQ